MKRFQTWVGCYACRFKKNCVWSLGQGLCGQQPVSASGVFRPAWTSCRVDIKPVNWVHSQKVWKQQERVQTFEAIKRRHWVKWYQGGFYWQNKMTSRPLKWDRRLQKHHTPERSCLFLVPSRNSSGSWQGTEAGIGEGLGVQRGGTRSWRHPSREGLPAVVLPGCLLKHRQGSARLGCNYQAAWRQRPVQDCGCPLWAQKQLRLQRWVEKGVICPCASLVTE